MTTRKPVSIIHNQWHDAQRVDQSDMVVEQDRNIQKDASIIDSHFGSGVLLESPSQNIVFDSDSLTAAQASLEAAGNFDGTGLDVHSQPSDINLGNQIEVELTGSSAFGRLSSKVAIIGLSFDDEIQMDRMYFYRDGKQVTSKHYKRILSIFFNDFKGNNNCSRNLGGRFVLREAFSFQLSEDPIMTSQDVHPDIFWRDFKVSDSTIGLFTTIQNGVGTEYSVDGLSINVTPRTERELVANDVTGQLGQKFQAKTDNIQKITLLLGARRDDTADEANRFDWTGDLVVSVYSLQTSTNCPTDIVPELAIEFDPSYKPITQLSYSQSELQSLGYVLTDVPQPVDFVFNATLLGSGATSGIIPGNFYAVTVGRSGAATAGTIFASIGNDRLSNSRLTVFTGIWTDVPEEDLWFQVWTDAAKIADGQGYDNGNGMLYEKTVTDESTGATIDNQIKYNSFNDTGEGIQNIGILQAIEDESVTSQDERTGNQVFSRKTFVPSFSFVSESGLATLKNTSNPLVIGCVEDLNPKINALIQGTQSLPGLAKDDTFTVVNPNPDLLSNNLIGSKLIPNSGCLENEYRIFKTSLCTDGYGDVNGDGYIDQNDIAAATALIGEGLALATTQQKIVDGYITTLELIRADVDGDGYVSAADVDLITNFVNRTINSFPVGTSFTHLSMTVQQTTGRFDGYYDCDGYVRLDGYTGLNIVDPASLSPYELLYDGYQTTPNLENDTAFTTVPYVAVDYRVEPQPFWQPYLLALSSSVRFVPASFYNDEAIVDESCGTPTIFNCDVPELRKPVCDPGRNDFYVPGNLLLRGQVLNVDSTQHSVDFEMGTVILQLPQEPLEEKVLNIFDKFVSDRGDGFTNAGFPAMRYADCTTVQPADLALNKIRFAVSIQAFVPNIDGYSDADGYGVIVDDIIGVHIDHSTGIMSLTIKDLFVDPVFLTLVTKIEINVFMKKAGWHNQVLVVDPAAVPGLLS